MLNERVSDLDQSIPFMELIQHYNARLRPNESGVKESALYQKIEIDECIVRSDDFGSVLEHVLSNFVNIVTLNHDINTLLVHNPPKRVMNSLQNAFGEDIEYLASEYFSIDRKKLKEIYSSLTKDILGQIDCKKQLISGLYKLKSAHSEKPAVLMMYGPSGVGKTETAKTISRVFGGDLLRIQFSMMQTNEALAYVFGSEHSKSSFAKDMLARETNIILIDEFDKVPEIFYNAFYELFDEGRYVDSNYNVELKNTIFLCTCNFGSEDEIKKVLGPAMFSRIGCCIEYKELSLADKCIIIDNWYKKILSDLEHDEQLVINDTNILTWFKENASRYDNIRILKTKLENAIYDKLSDEYIISEIK